MVREPGGGGRGGWRDHGGGGGRDGRIIAAELLEHCRERHRVPALRPELVSAAVRWNPSAVHRCYGSKMSCIGGPTGSFSTRCRLGPPVRARIRLTVRSGVRRCPQ